MLVQGDFVAELGSAIGFLKGYPRAGTPERRNAGIQIGQVS